MTSTAHSRPTATSRWAFAPVALLGFLLSIQAVMFRLATRDPGFAVEEDYYQRAVNWDEQMRQTATNQRLGWRLELAPRWGADDATTETSIRMSDARGTPLSGASITLTTFHNARSAQRQSAVATEMAPGTYVAPTHFDRAGLWEFRVTTVLGTETFTHVTQQDITPNLRARGPR